MRNYILPLSLPLPYQNKNVFFISSEACIGRFRLLAQEIMYTNTQHSSTAAHTLPRALRLRGTPHCPHCSDVAEVVFAFINLTSIGAITKYVLESRPLNPINQFSLLIFLSFAPNDIVFRMIRHSAFILRPNFSFYPRTSTKVRYHPYT